MASKISRSRQEEGLKTGSGATRQPTIEVLHLSRTFRDIGRALRDTLQAPIFFIALHPQLWADQYYGVLGTGDPECSRWLTKRVEELSGAQTADDWRALDSIAESLVGDLRGSDPDEVLGAAIDVLSRDPVRMGSRRLDNKDRGRIWESPSSAFFLTDGGIPAPGWFQDALDFGCYCGLSVDRFLALPSNGRGRGYCQFHWHFDSGTKARVLEVKSYVKREGLMLGRLGIFIAEYLYYLAAMRKLADAEPPRPSELDHFFLPLRGLGQWRASACWLVHDPIATPKPFKDHSSAPLHAALEELTTKSILESFGVRLKEALAKAQASNPAQLDLFEADAAASSLESLCAAFSTLWWADEILLLERDICRFRLARDTAGDLRACEAAEQPLGDLVHRDRLLAWEADGHEVLLQINLEALNQYAAKRARTVGISKVQFRVRLLNRPDAEREWRDTWAGYEAQLREILEVILE